MWQYWGSDFLSLTDVSPCATTFSSQRAPAKSQTLSLKFTPTCTSLHSITFCYRALADELFWTYCKWTKALANNSIMINANLFVSACNQTLKDESKNRFCCASYFSSLNYILRSVSDFNQFSCDGRKLITFDVNGNTKNVGIPVFVTSKYKIW